MKKIIFIFILYCLFCQNASQSQPKPEWFSTYGAGWGKNFLADFVIDSLGNSYLTGDVSLNATNARTGIGTVKFNSSGNQIWSHIYQGSSNRISIGTAVTMDVSGNVYVTGYCEDIDSLDNYCTIKYNSSGNVLWIKKYHSGDGGEDHATDVVTDSKCNVYVTGYNYGSNNFLTTIKYDSSGNVIWTKRYQGDPFHMKTSGKIALDDFDNVYVTGSDFSSNGSYDHCTISYDSSGNQRWVSLFDSKNRTEAPREVRIDNSGNVLALSTVIVSTGYHTLLIKYDNEGKVLWHDVTDSSGNNQVFFYRSVSFINDAFDNVYVTTTVNYHCRTMKYSQDGTLLWSRSFANSTFGIGINIDRFGKIYVAGSARTGNALEEFLVIKYDSEGNYVLSFQYHIEDAFEFDASAFVGFDKDNNLYLAGVHDGQKALYSLLKYSHSVGVSHNSNSLPENIALHQNFPNPFNPTTKIIYEITSPSKVTLTLYDVLGNEMLKLIDEYQLAGRYESNIDGINLPSGVYFYNLKAGNFSETKSMMLIK